tara:strand:+ start:2031 stop:2147 length:117 start_codon:yes stop_codon:yes gene_type:complete
MLNSGHIIKTPPIAFALVTPIPSPDKGLEKSPDFRIPP